MITLYTSFALLTAGVLMAIGVITLLIAIKSSSRLDFLFSAMALILAIYFVLPPVGFVLSIDAVFSDDTLWKRACIGIFSILLPWYILNYTGYQRKWMAASVSCLVLAIFIGMMLFANTPVIPAWFKAAIILFGISIMTTGIAAVRWQHKNGSMVQANWLLTAIVTYGFFYAIMVIDQFNNQLLASMIHRDMILPFHLHATFFTLLMGLRLTDSIVERLKHQEVATKKGENRWQSLMRNAPFTVLELDAGGNISYINNYGVKLLGYSDSTELLNTNWEQTFLDANDGEHMRQQHVKVSSDSGFAPRYKNIVRTKKRKELIIDWVAFLSPDQGTQNVVAIGTDITSEESANRLVTQLQQELEKEKIVMPDRVLSASDEIIGISKSLHYAISKAHQVANTLTPVLLEGETGVGKEVFANLIHSKSSRSHLPFIKVNCGALPKELIEDEFFGHEKGAFTSAIQSRKGRFEQADGGTIFLDEIGELPLDMQTRLLRVLQNGEFERVGGQKTIKVDVRIIAATNRKLSVEVQNSQFRADLYYRLNVFPITIPPLRKRKEDLPELIHHFIARESSKHNKSVDQISKANLRKLMDYNWPGNVRELKNVIERSVIETENNTLSLDWWTSEETILSTENTSLEQIEKEHILSIVEKCNWKINGENGAAEMLEMHPNTLRSRMKKLGISRPHSAKSDSGVLQEI